jgi:adenylate kinase
MPFRTILLSGAPGAGKGTQGKILGAIPDFFHCACGDVFRRLEPDSPLGRVFVQYSSRGELVPDETTVAVWRDYIERVIADRKFHPDRDTLLLDGLPRNLAQAEMLADTLHVVAMLYLVCHDFEKLVARLQRRALHESRLDDANADVIRQRFKTYEQETAPVVKFYGQSLVHEIDATQMPIQVLRDILRHIDRL